MWKWSEQHDKAFKDLTYRVKVDGHIIGSIRLLDGNWHWEVGFPLLKMPEGCNGVCPTKDQARQAIERRFNELVPLLMHGDRELAKWHLDSAALRAYLQEIG